MFPKLKNYIATLNLDSISEERKAILQILLDELLKSKASSNELNVNFVCTHNSRRSQLSQIWAQSLSHHFGLSNFSAYSSGTETTAVYPSIIDTLIKVGFKIDLLAAGLNPVYSIKYGENLMPIICFSKKLEHSYNPSSNFIAVMTCNQANQDCPLVIGANARIKVSYNDPKLYDQTPEQEKQYEQTSREIATELTYVFSKLAVN